MSPADQLAAGQRGEFTLGEMLRWASRRPHEVDLVDGEFCWFITALSADAAAEDEHGELRWQKASRDTSQQLRRGRQRHVPPKEPLMRTSAVAGRCWCNHPTYRRSAAASLLFASR